MAYKLEMQDHKSRHPGRPRGGKAPAEVREYWRLQKQKGDKEND